ncbi:hypothetical protein QWY85_15035 [Neolewinella lacunae]|uniref:Uncharacterized protein n=1 Tax=Neolewinella lacunae TaxID=1517758 RepID=A0A923PEP8_9BACT|nr:hypothetical protein [Neolewinella lacunae]MBC6992738.1 hypothetical protein [Neolewinella lacunae]MDN3635982.1 hypothetical protein [Neolewinella lacunae]
MTRFFFTLVFSILFSCAVFADQDGGGAKAGPSLFDQWLTESSTHITFRVNFDTLEANRKTENFFAATVIHNGEELELEAAVRGRFRRRTCVMPPLELKFAKDGLRAAGLNTHNDFKLVTHCTGDAAGQDALLREKLAYELYQTVAPNASYRTKLLTVTYVNTVDGSSTTSYGILIEDNDELQNRLDTDNCKSCYALPAEKITNAETLALFQFMIGNSDFSNRMVRNLKLLENANGTYTAVPYDFDYSGLVNATYANGFAHYNETKVTDRTLIWEYDTAPDFSGSVAYFVSLKDTLLQQVEDFDGLSAESKREITRYLKGFYKELASDAFYTAK